MTADEMVAKRLSALEDENERLRMALAIALDEHADDDVDVAAEFARCVECAEAVLAADTHEGDCTGVACTCLVCYGERLAYEMPGAITNDRPDYTAGFRTGIEAAARAAAKELSADAHTVTIIRNLKPEDGA